MLKEFKEFAIKGNVMDMGVGIIIGAAFTTVVNSLVNDLLMPPLAMVLGDIDFVDMFVTLREGASPGPYATLAQAKSSGAVVLSYGNFINGLVSFLLVALVLFFVVRWMNRLRRPDTPPAPNTKACSRCMSTVDIGATRCAYCTSDLTVAHADHP